MLSHVYLYDPMDCSPPGSSVHEIFQARIQQWVAISYSRGIFPLQGDFPHPEIKLVSLASSELAGGFFATVGPGKPSTVIIRRKNGTYE